MPELPEVETVCRSLGTMLIGRKIIDATVGMSKLIKIPAGDSVGFIAGITQATITAIDRRGKYILIRLDNGMILVVHLRMTGKLLYLDKSQPVGKHSHVIMILDNGYDVRFDDVRQFGALYLVKEDELLQIGGLATLGLEPLVAEFTLQTFLAVIKGKKQKTKVFLLDQRFVAGIGNIYADEILFQAHIHPLDTLDSLSQEDCANLWYAIKDRLNEGVAHGGSSIKDYVDALGQAGDFQNFHKAYGRFGKPCIECGTTIEKLKVAGRSTGYCPNCQPRRN